MVEVFASMILVCLTGSTTFLDFMLCSYNITNVGSVILALKKKTTTGWQLILCTKELFAKLN